MCGIAGGAQVDDLVAALAHRGERSRVDADRFPLGHVLLPIVGDLDQPLERDGRLVANCEIYDWRALAEEHGIDADNDADLLLALLDRHGTEALGMVDGVYAVAYQRGDELVLARDVLGVKPLYYATDPVAFASERRALERAGRDPALVHPRQIVRIDLDRGAVTREQRGFFAPAVDEGMGEDAAVEGVCERVRAAVAKRVPDEPVGVLFSGGLDSTLLAVLLQDAGADVTCYSAGIQHGNVDAPRDLDWAERVAAEIGVDHVPIEPDLETVADRLPVLADRIGAGNPVKLGVAATLDAALSACEERVVFSGLGAEQLYAGYSRQQGDLAKEGVAGLRGLFHRDLERDDIVAMHRGCELRLPLLDHALIEHALTVPDRHKVRDGTRKHVLRAAAERLGVPADVAWRGKTAAQYGSNMDKAIDRLARDAGASKGDYCAGLVDRPDHRLVGLVSGGKDSFAAVHRMRERNAAIACLLNVQSGNPDSYMFDSKDASLVERQAAAMGVPLVSVETAGEKERELADLEQGLARARDEHGVDGVVAGALASQYQRDRVDRVADRVGLKTFAPLWGTDPAQYLRWLVREGFAVRVTDVAARGLDDAWVGRVLDAESVAELIGLSEEHRFHAAGEGGEYETAVLDAPMFDGPVEPADT